MYPKTYFDHFGGFELENKVFVAMSFTKDFTARWESIFKPAIEAVGLHPFRTDVRTVSDSIHIDILHAIAHARLVLVDISKDSEGKRNSNVMYELGLAHATRLPEEVLVVRSEGTSDYLREVFDIVQIRSHRFSADEDGYDASRGKIELLLRSAMEEVDRTRAEIVERTIRSLDAPTLYVLQVLEEVSQDVEKMNVPAFGEGQWGILPMEEARRVFMRLHDLGILEVDPESFATFDPIRAVRVVCTGLGRALQSQLATKRLRL